MLRPVSFALLLPLVLLACGARAEEPTTSPGSAAAPEATTGSGNAQDPQSPDSGPVGGNCTYRDVPGTATVTAVESLAHDATIGTCYHARTHVTFTFTADDPSLLAAPLTNQTSLGIGDGVPTSCLEPSGVKVGATFALVRREEITGTCSPVIYDVPKTSTARLCVCTPCDDTGAAVCF